MATLGGVRDSPASENSVEIDALARFAVDEHNKKEHQEEEQDYERRNNSPLSSSSLSASQCRCFSLAEIKSATQNFDERLVIGKGGFGEVYKGIIDNGETTVAIKRLGFCSKQGAPEFWTEIEMLSKFRHSHLVSLIGYCDEKPEMVIVYEYMPGGTLADNLHKIGSSNRALSWEQRLKACIGGARGLDYLHTGTDIQTRVIHRDVKSSNILLDANLEAKISDFGLSKIGPTEQPFTHVSTHVKGTFGYLDPEYLLTRRLTRKSDVYAFGVVMFETLCGRAAVNVKLEEEQWSLAKWAKRCIKEGRLHEIVDPHLRGSILSECLNVFAQIAEHCLNNSSKKRPTMTQVVTRLEYALSLQEGNSFYLIDAEISGGKYDRQEASGLSTEAEPRDSGDMNCARELVVFNAGTGGYHQKHAAGRIKSLISSVKKMKFVKSMGSLFSTKDPELEDLKAELQGNFFNFQQLKAATQNFSSDNKLDEGGFGSVFKGILSDGTAIAVKQFSARSMQGFREFANEIGTVSALLHPNLVKLLGYCAENSQHLLVYEYMECNSLEHALFGSQELKKRLDWATRVKICHGIAKGLAFLHEESELKVVHRDIKPTNILLDKDLTPKITNFGFAKFYEGEATHIITRTTAGTTEYMAPEYAMRGHLTCKADVYSFGVVLLEIVSGKNSASYLPNDQSVYLLDLACILQKDGNIMELVDPDLEDYSWDEANIILNLALLCADRSYTPRPKMSEVVKILEGEKKISNYTIEDHYWMDDSAMAKVIAGLSQTTHSGSTSYGGTSGKEISST